MHSGSVTAGVLRGDRARFQLFGDTVNTASRMESNGKPGRAQLSEECAEELKRFGKAHWLEERPDRIQAKGKGTLKTFWLRLHSSSPANSKGKEGSHVSETSVSEDITQRSDDADLLLFQEKIAGALSAQDTAEEEHEESEA